MPASVYLTLRLETNMVANRNMGLLFLQRARKKNSIEQNLESNCCIHDVACNPAALEEEAGFTNLLVPWTSRNTSLRVHFASGSHLHIAHAKQRS